MCFVLYVCLDVFCCVASVFLYVHVSLSVVLCLFKCCVCSVRFGVFFNKLRCAVFAAWSYCCLVACVPFFSGWFRVVVVFVLCCLVVSLLS